MKQLFLILMLSVVALGLGPTYAQDDITGRIVFSALAPEPENQAGIKRAEVFVVNVGGSNLAQITDLNQYLCRPRWSPDGQQIAFVNSMTPFCEGNIMLVSADGTGMVSVTSQYAAYSLYRSPRWSPDGNLLAFEAPQRIHIVPINEEFRNLDPSYSIWLSFDLPSSHISNYGLAWSPDGQRLAYAWGGGMLHHINILDLDGFALTSTSPSGLSDESLNISSAGSPVWSPDGQQIAFVSTNANGAYIVKVDEPHGVDLIQMLVETFGVAPEVQALAWSSDGQQLAVIGTTQGDDLAFLDNVYVFEADGGNPRLVFGDEYRKTGLQWIGNDRQYLVYIGAKEGARAIYTLDMSVDSPQPHNITGARIVEDFDSY